MTEMTTEVALNGSVAPIVLPENKLKFIKAVSNFETTLISAGKAFFSGELEEAALYEPVLTKQIKSIENYLNTSALPVGLDNTNSENFLENLKKLSDLGSQFVSEFGAIFKTSKALPYIKIACNFKDSLKTMDPNSLMVTLTQKNLGASTPESTLKALDMFDGVCSKINSIDSIYDSNVESSSSTLNSMLGLIANPFSIIDAVDNLLGA